MEFYFEMAMPLKLSFSITCWMVGGVKQTNRTRHDPAVSMVSCLLGPRNMSQRLLITSWMAKQVDQLLPLLDMLSIVLNTYI